MNNWVSDSALAIKILEEFCGVPASQSLKDQTKADYYVLGQIQPSTLDEWREHMWSSCEQ